MPAVVTTIDQDQREGIYELIRNHLGSIEDIFVALERTRDFAKAERLALEFAEDFRLLRDIGWADHEDRETFEPTMPASDLSRLLQRLHAEAVPALMRAKIRRAELDAGAPPRPRRHDGKAVSASAREKASEREMVERAEAAYRRLVADWQATGAKGAGATRGRASSGPSAGQAARQESAPEPAL
ncbi:MAG: hypothetical protein R2725_07445 [Solirubrobacterales bacterium]